MNFYDYESMNNFVVSALRGEIANDGMSSICIDSAPEKSYYPLLYNMIHGDEFIDNANINIGHVLINALSVVCGQMDGYTVNYYSSTYDEDVFPNQLYGPRLVNWIGPDDLQESIREYEEYEKLTLKDKLEYGGVKPKGSNQLKTMFSSLIHRDNPDIPNCITLFDPSLDSKTFSVSPSVSFMQFNYDSDNNQLTIAFSLRKCTEQELVSGCFLVDLIAGLISYQIKNFGYGTPIVFVNIIYSGIVDSKDIDNPSYICYNEFNKPCYDNEIKMGTPQEFFDDCEALYQLIRHMKSHLPINITERNLSIVNPIMVCQSIVNKIMDKDVISTSFVRGYGVALVIYGLISRYKRGGLQLGDDEKKYIQALLDIDNINMPLIQY